MYRIMMVASKKALTRKWLKTEVPTVDDWINVVFTVYVMEKLSFSLRLEADKFERIWQNWLEYVRPLRSNLI